MSVRIIIILIAAMPLIGCGRGADGLSLADKYDAIYTRTRLTREQQYFYDFYLEDFEKELDCKGQREMTLGDCKALLRQGAVELAIKCSPTEHKCHVEPAPLY